MRSSYVRACSRGRRHMHRVCIMAARAGCRQPGCPGGSRRRTQGSAGSGTAPAAARARARLARTGASRPARRGTDRACAAAWRCSRSPCARARRAARAGTRCSAAARPRCWPARCARPRCPGWPPRTAGTPGARAAAPRQGRGPAHRALERGPRRLARGGTCAALEHARSAKRRSALQHAVAELLGWTLL